jgi:hypothetical protein
MTQHQMSHPQRASADYIVVTSNDDDHLEGFHHFADKVNRKLKSGYELHGQPFCVNGRVLCQAMIRFDGPAHSGETTMFFKHPATSSAG